MDVTAIIKSIIAAYVAYSAATGDDRDAKKDAMVDAVNRLIDVPRHCGTLTRYCRFLLNVVVKAFCTHVIDDLDGQKSTMSHLHFAQFLAEPSNCNPKAVEYMKRKLFLITDSECRCDQTSCWTPRREPDLYAWYDLNTVPVTLACGKLCSKCLEEEDISDKKPVGEIKPFPEPVTAILRVVYDAIKTHEVAHPCDEGQHEQSDRVWWCYRYDYTPLSKILKKAFCIEDERDDWCMTKAARA